MATGPEHYRIAEGLLALTKTDSGRMCLDDGDEQYIAAAQVHATLALAAATAMATYNAEDMPHRDWEAWSDAAQTFQSTHAPALEGADANSESSR